MTDWLGKLLYPQMHPVLRREKMQLLGRYLKIGLLVAVLVAIVFWFLSEPSSTSPSSGSSSGGSAPLMPSLPGN